MAEALVLSFKIILPDDWQFWSPHSWQKLSPDSKPTCCPPPHDVWFSMKYPCHPKQLLEKPLPSFNDHPYDFFFSLFKDHLMVLVLFFCFSKCFETFFDNSFLGIPGELSLMILELLAHVLSAISPSESYQLYVVVLVSCIEQWR